MRRFSVDPSSLGKQQKSSEKPKRRLTVADSTNVILQNNASDNDLRKLDADSSPVPTVASSVPVNHDNNHDMTDGNESEVQKTRVAIATLQQKMQQTKEQIREEQKTQAENVNEYLELSVSADKSSSQQLKSIFEKKNIKSTQNILHLQSKQDSYRKRLTELELHGVSGPKEKLKNVGHGLNGFSSSLIVANESMVSKPAEFASMIKHKFGSTDNVSIDKETDDQKIYLDDPVQLNVMALSGAHHSTDHDLTSSISGPKEHLKSSQDNIPKQARSNSQHSAKAAGPLPPQSLQELHAQNNQLRNNVAALKIQVHVEYTELKQSLEMQRDFCEHLEEQLNDLTELHQNEITEIKQEMVSLEEKVQYTLDDRTRDLHELVESCLERVTKVEQQQHQQLIQNEGLDNSGFSIAKIINFILAFLSFCLILLSTVASLLSPFIATRSRYFMSFCFVVLTAFIWKNWEFVSGLLASVLQSWFPGMMKPEPESSHRESVHNRSTAPSSSSSSQRSTSFVYEDN